MNLIIDENLPPNWCEFLVQHGHNAMHWQDIGKHGDPDELIFDHAQAGGHVILTQDLDFSRILALRGTSLPSLIQLRVDCPIPAFAGEPVLQILSSYQESLSEGALVTLQSDRHRIRLLPLR